MRVGLIGVGEMGSAVGGRLAAHGASVRTVLDGRSERTRILARDAGIGDAPTLAALIGDSDIVLSIVPPAQATAVAREVCVALHAASASGVVYADCNAIAPSTVRAIGELATAAGGGFVDVGIIGSPPPRGASDTRFFASGPGAARFAELGAFGLDVHVISAEIGDASAVKMTYAASTKGTTAIATQLLVAAHALGVYDVVVAELERSPSFAHLVRSVPRVPSVAHRWSGEMEEIAKTFAEVGLTPRTFEGAADLYHAVEDSELGGERPETRDYERGLAETVRALARAILTKKKVTAKSK